MEVNHGAPVVASDRIDINADPDTVWEVISAIDAWPSWNPAIKTASLNGPLAEGTTFRWKAGPGTITSTLRQVSPPQVLAWTGRTMGIKAVHVYQLEPREGGTVVHTAESWEGLAARLMRRSMQRQLENALGPGLERLKEESERRARMN
jgi:uncharacterized protein YndB with AHSA1/START domain